MVKTVLTMVKTEILLHKLTNWPWSKLFWPCRWFRLKYNFGFDHGQNRFERADDSGINGKKEINCVSCDKESTFWSVYLNMKKIIMNFISRIDPRNIFELIVSIVIKNFIFLNVYLNMKKFIMNLISISRFGLDLRKMFELFVCTVV